MTCLLMPFSCSLCSFVFFLGEFALVRKRISSGVVVVVFVSLVSHGWSGRIVSVSGYLCVVGNYLDQWEHFVAVLLEVKNDFAHSGSD